MILRYSSVSLSILRANRAILRVHSRSASSAPKRTQGVSKKLLVLTATGCVGYFSALAWYSYRGPSGAASSLPLNPSYFTPVTILSSENTTPSTKLITLKIPPSSLPSQTTSSLTPIFSIYIKDSDIQVERPYTPLTGISQDGTLKLWIKKYEKGEVGRWIHGKKVGESIEIRGPVRNWEWKDGVWDDVVMISGGTGITPFVQLLNSVFSPAPEEPLRTRFTLLHSSPTPSSLPPAEILEPLREYASKRPDSFFLQLHVDSLDKDKDAAYRNKVKEGRIGKRQLEDTLRKRGIIRPLPSWWDIWDLWVSNEHPQPRKVLFLVCGPEPMISALAGPRARIDIQGPVGGVLAEMGFDSKQVRKL